MNSSSERKPNDQVESAMFARLPPLANCCCFGVLAVLAWLLVGAMFAWIAS